MLRLCRGIMASTRTRGCQRSLWSLPLILRTHGRGFERTNRILRQGFRDFSPAARNDLGGQGNEEPAPKPF